MPSHADDDLASNRALADVIIRDAFRRDPDRVVVVVAEVIERLKAERGYSAHELDAVAQVLLDELSAGTTGTINKQHGHADGDQ